MMVHYISLLRARNYIYLLFNDDNILILTKYNFKNKIVNSQQLHQTQNKKITQIPKQKTRTLFSSIY